MEHAPQPQYEASPEGAFDREAVAAEARQTAKKLIAEHVDESMQPEERENTLQILMEELAEDNGNRFIVEAIAQQRSRDRLVQNVQSFDAVFPHVEAANDEESYANAA